MKRILIIGLMIVLSAFIVSADEAWEFHMDNGTFLVNASNLIDTKYCTYSGSFGLLCTSAGVGGGSEKWTIDDDTLINDTGVLKVNESALTITESQISDLSHTIDTTIPKWTIDDNSLINDSAILKVSEAWVNETIENYTAITYYNATSVSLVAGSSSSSLNDLLEYNNNAYNISEEVGSPSIDFRINFTGVDNFNRVVLRLKTYLHEHISNIYIWDYDSSSWESYSTFIAFDDWSFIELSVYDVEEHISGGLVQMRILNNENGNINHWTAIDWITLIDGPATFSTTETDPLSWHIGDNINLNDNNLTLGGGFGSGGISLYDTGSAFFGNDIFIGGDILTLDTQTINGSFLPNITNTYDLGSSALQWKDVYIDGTLEADAITIGGTAISSIYEVQLNNEAGLYAVLSDVTEFIETSDSATLTSLNTGQGAYELYAMNQDVETTDAVTFHNISLTETLGIGSDLVDVIEFSSGSIAGNSTHLCIVGTSKLCVEI